MVYLHTQHVAGAVPMYLPRVKATCQSARRPPVESGRLG